MLVENVPSGLTCAFRVGITGAPRPDPPRARPARERYEAPAL